VIVGKVVVGKVVVGKVVVGKVVVGVVVGNVGGWHTVSDSVSRHIVVLPRPGLRGSVWKKTGC
jgi:hypothetical protein